MYGMGGLRLAFVSGAFEHTLVGAGAGDTSAHQESPCLTHPDSDCDKPHEGTRLHTKIHTKTRG
jgi:hypothetical protein